MSAGVSRKRCRLVTSLFALVLLGLALAAPSPALAQAEDDVVINEFVVNPSAGREYVELLVTKPGGVDMRGWTLSDVGTRAGATGATEGDLTFPSASYLEAVPQGTYVVVVLAVPTANTNTIPEDLSNVDGNRRLVLVAGTTGGLTASGVLDNATADNLQLYAGTRATGTLIDQILVGGNTSYIAGATWGDNDSTTTTDNINGSSSVPSNSSIRFVPAADTLAEFQNNDTGSRFVVETNSYGSPGERNAGVTGDTALGGTASTSPTASGAASPSSVEAGEQTLLTVTVTPGTNPASTGITVTGNLTSIGGSASQPFFDNGTNGDVTAGDNVFSYQATVTPGTTGGSKTIPVNVNDAQGRSSSTSISLTVVEVIPIGTVQGPVTDTTDGATHRSPYAPPPANPANPCATSAAGQTVTIQGVIYQKTLARTNAGANQHGFFIQNTAATRDADPNTSDGIFVFMGNFTNLLGGYVPQVGHEVVLSARVTEFNCLTQLTSATLVRVVRTGVVVDTEVPPFIAFPPDFVDDANRYWERREGMRGQAPVGSITVGRRQVFGPATTMDGEDAFIAPTHPVALRPNEYARRTYRDPHPADNRPELWDDGNGFRIILGSMGVKAAANDNTALIAPARTYDRIAVSPPGGLYFSFSKYIIHPEAQITLTPGADPSQNAPPRAPARPGEYSMADYNVENLYDYRDDPFDGCDFAGNAGCTGVNPPFDYVPSSQVEYEMRLRDVATQIIQDLHSPEIIMTQEAEDQDICTVTGGTMNCGTTNNADGKPDTLQELALVIRSLGGPVYDAAFDRDGADARGIISPIMYRTDRVELLPASAGHPVLGSSPTVSYRGTPLAYNTHVQNPKVLNAVRPADVDTSTGTDGPNVFTRAPQVGHFRIWEQAGRTGTFFDVYAISNHFSSTPQNRVGQRREQARYNAAIVQAIQTIEPQARIDAAGDYNVFPRPDDPYAPGHPLYPTDQLAPLYDAGLINLWDVLAAEVPASAYSYVFDMQAQTLDMHFVTPSLRSELRQFRMAHVNADYPTEFDSPGARGISDHDPGVAIFAAPAASTDLSVTKAASTDTVYPGAVLTYTLTVRNGGPSTATGVTLTDTLPESATFVGVTSTQGTCEGRTTVTCALGTLASGASARVVLDVRPTRAGSMTNTAEVRGGAADPVAANNSASVTTTVAMPPRARPTARGCEVSASPRALTVGKRAVLRVAVAMIGPREPAAQRAVVLRGAGVRKNARTTAGGTVRVTVKPTRAGAITVRAPGAEGATECVARVAVRRARAGAAPALTGRP